ncbi:Pectinesterase [Bertholletia excelsa]
MASKPCFAIFISLLIFLPSLSSSNTSSTISTVCNNTLYPSFCRNLLSKGNSSSLYDYGRFSLKKSLSSARKFSSLINRLLHRSSSLTPTAVAALQDCRFLAELNLDYLYAAIHTLNGASNAPLPTIPAENVQTLLGGILTNIDTCLDGIAATRASWSVKQGVFAPMVDDTKLYSVSLDLFTKAWVPNKKNRVSERPRKHLTFRKGKLPFRMSKRHKAILDSLSSKKFAQESGDDGLISVSDIVGVSQDGQANFTSINDAVQAAPDNSNADDGYFLIYITAGVYNEYVSIPKNKKYLMMMGEGINQTIITGNHSFVDGWGTFNSSTFSVVGERFVGVGITFRNTAGPIKHQAVAVRNTANQSTFYNCSFEAYQDTLYVHNLYQFYRECDIYGTVDFIFGNAIAVFQKCNIYPRLPLSGQFNAITAQGREVPNQNTGIWIQNCTIRPAADLATANSSVETYLGRPWRLYSRTVYMQSFMDSFIQPLGWHKWNESDFALNTSYYAEFGNRGPGSSTAARVTWPGFRVINATDAANFTVSNLLLGDEWLPQTGVPYD